MNEKKLLIVSTNFPPDARAGTHRVVRFTKYLARLGWDISVLTLKPEYSLAPGRKDPALLRKIPASVQVHRTAALRLRWPLSGLNSFLVPDKEAGWIPFAYRAALRIIRDRGVTAVYSTAPPWSAHVVGWWLKSRTGVAWIADIRDPWTRRPWMAERDKRGARYALRKRIERRVVETADQVVLNTPPLCREFREHYNDLPAEKFTTITNGIDPDDFRDLPSPTRAEPRRYVITHGGSLYRKRDPSALLEALGELRKQGRVSEREVLFQFVGGVDPAFDMPRRIRELGLEQLVQVKPLVAHEEYLGLLSASDLLLLIQPETDLQIPSKLFEYMAIGKPVLALTHEGATRELVEQYGGRVVDPYDVAGIKTAILAAVNDKGPPEGTSRVLSEEVAQYTLPVLTKSLDGILMDCTAK